MTWIDVAAFGPLLAWWIWMLRESRKPTWGHVRRWLSLIEATRRSTQAIRKLGEVLGRLNEETA